jgi:3-methyladenine DNA glycosylase AlkD
MKVRSQSLSTQKKPFNTRSSAREWTVRRAITELKRHGKSRYAEGMIHFGIHAKKTFGVSKPKLDQITRKIGKNHVLGLKLWETGVHDAQLLGILICEPERVTAVQMERWVKDFGSWDVCDGACCHLFVDARPAWNKAKIWTTRKREFEKRAGFALIAYLAIHDNAAKDGAFQNFLKIIERESSDERNFVRKAVNWALRNIGKRSRRLNQEAIAAAERIRQKDSKAARWIATDALRELKSEAVQNRLLRKGS